jgi:hypothetical protein
LKQKRLERRILQLGATSLRAFQNVLFSVKTPTRIFTAFPNGSEKYSPQENLFGENHLEL